MLLVIYTHPRTARVRLTLDSGVVVEANTPVTLNGRDDAHPLDLPDDTPFQGSSLHVEAEGYLAQEGRGLLVPDPNAPDSATFQYDDVHLAVPPVPAPPDRGPVPPNPDDPWAVIQWVYSGGTGVTFDLRTHDGCGQFTEACALTLFVWTAPTWGHVLKNPGQNQYNGHAVDAIHALAGDDAGIWDIIQSSVSLDAKPCFNLAGPPAPEIWGPPVSAPAPTTRRQRR